MTVYVLLAAALIVLIVIGFPVGFAAGLISLIGAAVLFDGLLDPRVPAMLARIALDKIDSFLLLAIPFFLLAGRLMNCGGITERLFGFVSLVTRPVKGGLGHANVMASVAFAGMSGSATADAVGLGTIEMRAMLAQGYDRKFSAAVTGASSLLSPILPPSIALVAFAVQAEQSVGELFVAAILPGVIMALAYMAYVAYFAWRLDLPSGPLASLAELGRSFRTAIWPVLTPVIIVGGIWGGIFTPTEAAAVAAFYALFLGMAVYREIGWQRLLAEIRATVIDSAVIMLIIAFTSAFGVIMIRGQVPSGLAAFLTTLTSDPSVFLLLMMLLWLAVGCFMAQTPAILILTPILMPIAEQYAIHPVHFGIVMTVTLTLGLLTPPVGMILYALVRVTGLSFEQLSLVSMPIVALTLVVAVLLALFPQLVLFLPQALFRP
jgi:tripartite ATP-independent transporter DctM subunit